MSTITLAVDADEEAQSVTFIAPYTQDPSKTLTLRFVPSGMQEGEASLLQDPEFWEMCHYEVLVHLSGEPRIKTATWEYEWEQNEDSDEWELLCWEADWVIQPEYHG